MFDIHHLTRGLFENWPIWIVTITLIVAAVIDGLKLKVPNWITFPMILSGWVYSAVLSPYFGWEGLMYSVLGTIVGLALLLPAYAIGGMGAGDVKLLAGVGLMAGGAAALGSVVFALALSGVVIVVLLATRRIGRRTYIPFGPFFIIGALWAVLIRN